MREISFEMARHMGLTPKMSDRRVGLFEGSFMFEGFGYAEKRRAAAEAGYSAELDRIRQETKDVYLRGEKLKVV